MTQEPDQPSEPPTKDAKGRFLPGNKVARGRPRGSQNKFGPGFRDKLLAGIARSGTKKAKKAGINHKVDGFEYFVENLVDSNGGAAATLIAKLIPPEQPPELPAGPGVIINLRSAAEGQQFAPGNEVLMPFEDAGKAWAAFNNGPNVWKEYLQEIEASLTLAAFQKLCALVPPEPKFDASNTVQLRHLTDDDNESPTQRRVPMAIEPRGAAVSEPDRQQLLRHAEFHSARMRTICAAQPSGRCVRGRACCDRGVSGSASAWRDVLCGAQGRRCPSARRERTLSCRGHPVQRRERSVDVWQSVRRQPLHQGLSCAAAVVMPDQACSRVRTSITERACHLPPRMVAIPRRSSS
jgi:hypothetical protein